jgi:hypothetical protein
MLVDAPQIDWRYLSYRSAKGYGASKKLTK